MIVDGRLEDWTVLDRIDRGTVSGHSVYARSDGSDFIFALKAPGAIGANTTVWLNTDRNAATGYQIFGFAGGAEYNVNVGIDGSVSLYSGGAGETLVRANLTAAWSADRTVLEFRVPKAAIGNPKAVDTLFDVNDNVFLPGSYSDPQFTVFNDTGIVADPADRIAIVWSESTAKNYFSETAYSQLFMAAQSQAMQAGVPFDILTEADLTDLATLAKYDTIVFPSFRNVEASQANLIAQTLEQATKQFGIGLIAAGEFMTNAADGSALAGNSYARMQLLFDATRVAGGFPANVTVTASDAGKLVLDGYDNGQVIRQYTGVGWNAFTSVSGAGTTIATETVNGQAYAAALATTTGGRNVLFSSEAVMVDDNLLQKAIDYSVHGSGLSVGLQMTRQAGMVAARVDMDQSQEREEVNPQDGSAGIYDRLLPILADWKEEYDFVGSYYVNVGNDAANGRSTDWAVSLPYYKQLIDMGNEIGTHSYTHPENTNVLTDAQIAFEFGTSRAELESRLSAYLGRTVTIAGAAVPGAPEGIATSQEILQYVSYLSGGYSGVGAGYPNAIGYMTPGNAADGLVYIAPNTAFDFTLMEFQNKTVAEAEAIWAKEFATLTAEADAPVVVWPWHDYGPTAWSTEGASPYVTQMFTNWIARAAAAGMEFVTLADLASRVRAAEAATITSTVAGSTITTTVSSTRALGSFALDVDGQGTQVIKSVANWYAYDGDTVFLPQAGGTFAITMGAAADDVTHITALPQRATLMTLSGNGRDLSFTVVGEGDVVIDLKAPSTDWVTVSGATVQSLAGEMLTIDLGATGSHDVRIGHVANAGPSITSFGGAATGSVSVAENATAVATLAATDANVAQGDSVRWSIKAGGDGAQFGIDAATGALSFRTAPDYEAPTDANRDNRYAVTVVATDARGATDTQTLTVSVTNVVGVTRTGTSRADTLTGTSEADTLNGAGGNDILNGGAGTDLLVGGTGTDRLTGGAGRDTFRFGSASESLALGSLRDVITDFRKGEDKIDLSGIDASFFGWGDQAFTLLGTPGARFTGAGQLRFSYEKIDGQDYTIVEGNTDLLPWADFSVGLVGLHALNAGDFVL